MPLCHKPCLSAVSSLGEGSGPSQILPDHFWTSFIHDYLPNLQPRGQWLREVQNLEVGNTVLIFDSQLPRASWATGRVTTVTTGRDGCVQSVDVQVGGQIYTRPVSRLMVLPELAVEWVFFLRRDLSQFRGGYEKTGHSIPFLLHFALSRIFLMLILCTFSWHSDVYCVRLHELTWVNLSIWLSFLWFTVTLLTCALLIDSFVCQTCAMSHVGIMFVWIMFQSLFSCD